MASVEELLSKIQTQTNMVVALPVWEDFEPCVSQKKEGDIDYETMKGKELDTLLRKFNLKISGKVEEKKTRLREYFKDKNL